MCTPAPAVLRYGKDVADRFGIPTTYNVPGPGGVYLGSVGDQDHATRKSSHNCAPMQEDGDYAPDHSHAWDARPKTKTIGLAMVKATIADDRVRYVLYADRGYKPDGTDEDISDNPQFTLDHDTFHVSFLPGAHDDTRPFFTDNEGGLTMGQFENLQEMIVNQGQRTRRTIRRVEAREELRRAREDKADDREIRRLQKALDALGPDED